MKAKSTFAKSRLAKFAVVGGLGAATLGIGAGVASADPAPGNHPGQSQDHNQPAHNQPGQNQPGEDHRQPNRPDDHRDQQHTPQPQQHGFWLFGQWVPLP